MLVFELFSKEFLTTSESHFFSDEHGIGIDDRGSVSKCKDVNHIYTDHALSYTRTKLS